MANASDFLSSNFLNSTSVPPNVVIETEIVSARPHEFEDGVKLVLYVTHLGKGVVCNQGRLKTMIEAYGVAYEAWVGKIIRLSRGETTYQGRKTGCVEIEPVSPPLLMTEQRGRPQLKSVETPPAPKEPPDGPDDPEDSIPF